MHEVLVNRLGDLSLPRKSVVRLTDRPDMTLDVYRGRKTTMQKKTYIHIQNRYRKITRHGETHEYSLKMCNSGAVILCEPLVQLKVEKRAALERAMHTFQNLERWRTTCMWTTPLSHVYFRMFLSTQTNLQSECMDIKLH